MRAVFFGWQVKRVVDCRDAVVAPDIWSKLPQRHAGTGLLSDRLVEDQLELTSILL